MSYVSTGPGGKLDIHIVHADSSDLLWTELNWTD